MNISRTLGVAALFLGGTLLHAHAADTSKIVSLGGSVTEIVVELGFGDKLVGVDESSRHPMPALAKLPKTGYYRQIGAEGVLALEPTLVITTSDAGPAEALGQLKAAGVDVQVVPEKKSLEGAREKITKVAEILGAQPAGEKLLAKFDASLAEARAKVKAAEEKDAAKPKVLFIMNADGAGSMSVAGSQTGADEMIREAGGVNVAADLQRYQGMSIEAIAAAAPDVVLIPAAHGPSAESLKNVAKSPALANSPAGKNGRIYTIDLELLAGYGPRAAEGLNMVVGLLHPEAVQSASE